MTTIRSDAIWELGLSVLLLHSAHIYLNNVLKASIKVLYTGGYFYTLLYLFFFIEH